MNSEQLQSMRSCVTWSPLRASHSHAAAVLSDAVVRDLGDDLRVGLQVEEENVVRLQISIDDHGRVKVPDDHKLRTCSVYNENEIVLYCLRR